MKLSKKITALFCAVIFLSVCSRAADEPEDKTKDDGHKELLQGFAGQWEGSCRTWFHPGKVADESKVAGTIKPILNGKFLRHTYESSMMGKPRHGEETIVFNGARNEYQVTWFDDFHMGYGILFSQGAANDKGFTVSGKYDVSPGSPVWGWKTVYELTDKDHLTIAAYNVTPDGEETKAVETTYTRK